MEIHVEYTISDRLKFLFSILCSPFLLLCSASLLKTVPYMDGIDYLCTDTLKA